MRHTTKAVIGVAVVVAVAFFIFAPVVLVPTSFAVCGYGCFTQYQYSSLTAVLLGHGGYYFEGHYSIH